eukprot:Pgem_evm1s16108
MFQTTIENLILIASAVNAVSIPIDNIESDLLPTTRLVPDPIDLSEFPDCFWTVNFNASYSNGIIPNTLTYVSLFDASQDCINLGATCRGIQSQQDINNGNRIFTLQSGDIVVGNNNNVAYSKFVSDLFDSRNCNSGVPPLDSLVDNFATLEADLTINPDAQIESIVDDYNSKVPGLELTLLEGFDWRVYQEETASISERFSSRLNNFDPYLLCKVFSGPNLNCDFIDGLAYKLQVSSVTGDIEDSPFLGESGVIRSAEIIFRFSGTQQPIFTIEGMAENPNNPPAEHILIDGVWRICTPETCDASTLEGAIVDEDNYYRYTVNNRTRYVLQNENGIQMAVNGDNVMNFLMSDVNINRNQGGRFGFVFGNGDDRLATFFDGSNMRCPTCVTSSFGGLNPFQNLEEGPNEFTPPNPIFTFTLDDFINTLLDMNVLTNADAVNLVTL